MTAALALVPIVIKALPMIETGVEGLINWISGVRIAAKQADMWTPELETAYLDSLIATKSNPAYQPDAKVSQGGN